MVYDPHPLKVGDRVEVEFGPANGFSKKTKRIWATILEVRPNMDIAWSYRVHYDAPELGYENEGWVGDLHVRPLTLLERVADAAREDAP